jgi:Domain of unknown function (DUF4326)
MAHVINIRTINGSIPSGAIYIGRTNPRYGLPDSKWKNPFKEKLDGTREEIIAKFREYLLGNARLMAALHELRGCDLGLLVRTASLSW